MRCIILSTISFFFFLSAKSQLSKRDYIKLIFDYSPINKEVALRDIASHRMRIFGQRGLDPTAYSRSDSIFESKYKVTYILFGCTSPFDEDKMKEYNLEIGKYLDSLYGRQWRKQLHPDVIALRDE